jgi:hypothetical protein
MTASTSAHNPGERPLPGRLFEWLWGGQAVARARAKLPEAALRERLRQAETALDAAAVAEERADAGLADHSVAVRVAIYREAILWSLATRMGSAVQVPASLQELASGDGAALASAAGSEQALESVRALALRPAAEVLGLTAELRKEHMSALAALAKSLYRLAAGSEREVQRAITMRVLRLGLLVVLMLGAAMTVRRVVVGKDLLADAHWKASGSYGEWPEEGVGPSGHEPMFHTDEQEAPSITFELGRPMDVARLVIVNRKDCCQERAIPMIVEASVNGEDWQQVAERKDAFNEWTAMLGPTKASHLRLRVLNKTFFHLSEVHAYGP